MGIGRETVMQPHVLATLHMRRCGAVLVRETHDELTFEVVHGEYTVAGTLSATAQCLMKLAKLWSPVSFELL